MNQQDFIAAVQAAAPGLTELLQEDDGLLSLQVGSLARHVQSLIDHGRADELRVCLALVERALGGGDATVVNALGVAFFEHLNFSDGKCKRAWAWRSLPPRSMALIRLLGRDPAGGLA